MKRMLLLATAALAAVFVSTTTLAAPLLPEILFKDTFDSAKPSDDINLDAATRQSALLAPLTYTTLGTAPQVGQDGFTGVVKLNSNSHFSPNQNFTAGGTFSIEI